MTIAEYENGSKPDGQYYLIAYLSSKAEELKPLAAYESDQQAIQEAQKQEAELYILEYRGGENVKTSLLYSPINDD